MARKYDGVIEAVRYRNGQIVMVRAYERRGAAFSDRVLIERKALVEKLQQGRKFVTGARVQFRAGTFTVGRDVSLVEARDRAWISTHPAAAHDDLEGVPVF